MEVEETYCTAVDHAAGDSHLGRELVAFALHRLVHFANVAQFVPALCGSSPRLYQLQDLRFDLRVDSSGPDGLQERCQVIHELLGCNLGEEVGAAVLEASIGKLQQC